MSDRVPPPDEPPERTDILCPRCHEGRLLVVFGEERARLVCALCKETIETGPPLEPESH